MRAASLFTLVYFGTALAVSVPRRQRSERAILGRDEDLDDYDIFPFPANQSDIVDASTEPSESPPQDLTVTEVVGTDKDTIPIYFPRDHNCSDPQKQIILQSWNEARLLQRAQTEHVDGYTYNIPHTQWLGKDWNSKGSWIPWKYNYRKLIGDNFKRLRAVFRDQALGYDNIFFLCNDRYGECKNTDIFAYSWDSDRGPDDPPGYDHGTVFCPNFYDQPSLMEPINALEGDKHGQKVIENFELTRAQLLFHEMWHYWPLVSNPKAWDTAVGADNAWELAKRKDRGTHWAYVNADSYALDALAIFVQQHYSSAMSPVPYKELAAFDAEAAAAVPQPEKIDYPTPLTFGPEGPPGWVAPDLIDGKPSEDEWEEVFPNGGTPVTDLKPDPELKPALPAADENDCHGISGDYWVEDRDVAAANVEDFCSQPKKTVTYNADSANELELSVRKLDDNTLGAEDAPYCVDRFMNAVIDGCDGDDPDKNPDNHKYGSTLTTSDGWEYKMTPLNAHVNKGEDDNDSDLPGPDACPVSGYPGAAGINEIPAWMEANLCSKVCPGGDFGLCPIVDSDAPEPRTGVCQCTSVSQECIDDGRYTCYSPESP